MATSLAEIERHLAALELSFKKKDDEQFIRTGFRMDHYSDPDGRSTLSLIIALEEDGEYIKVIAPSLYRYKDGPNKLSVLQACLQASWMTKLAQFEYDPADGEIRGIIEFPLEDAAFTRRQLSRMLNGLARIVDKIDPMVREAMTTGKLIVEKGGEDLRVLGEMASAVGALGADEVRRLIEETAKK